MSLSVAGAPPQEHLQEILAGIRAATRVPGLGIAVSVNGKRVDAYSGEPALGQQHTFSARSRFQLSCLMKLLLSLTVLELSDDGIIDLEQPIEEYLPEFIGWQQSAGVLCVRHLMTHASGYRGVDISNSRVRWNYSWEHFIRHCRAQQYHFPPGSVFNYEHTEHVILGEIVRRVCGREAPTVIQERILSPLNIRLSCTKSDKNSGESYVAQHAYALDRNAFVPVSLAELCRFWDTSLSGATLTLQDMLSLGEALLTDRNSPEACALFADNTRAALQVAGPPLPPQVASGISSEQMPESFGLGFAHYSNGILGHNGSTFGQTCTLRVDRARKVVLAVGINAWAPNARDRAVSRTLACIASNGHSDYLSTPAALSQFKLERLMNGFTTRDIVGRYLGSYYGEIQVSWAHDTFVFDLGSIGPKRPRITAVAATAHGDYVIQSSTPALVGFFKDPERHGVPALMMGMHAYKRVMPAAQR
jgi:CubicO group peptidase (beta-lactamase class C family)